MLTCLLPDPSIIAFEDIQIETNGESIACRVSSKQTTTACSVCKEPTSRIHSRYQRKLSDLPWAGMPVQLWLEVRRFSCRNPDCCRRIFCERIPTIAAPWARRTQRMADAQQALGFAAGGAGGSRLCVALAMDAGIDLLLALIRNGPDVEYATPRVLGVDDWAMRKGQTYGTILVDLEEGNVVDLLPDRTAEGLEKWLKAHPGVEIISRDRARAYAEGARNGAPDAIQVADRWHLLKNLTDAIYKILQKHQAEIEKKLTDERESSADRQESACPVTLSIESMPDGHSSAADISRQTRVKKAHKLHQEGWTNKAIALELDVCSKTVGRYLNMELPLPPLRRSGRKQVLDPFKPYIIERWNAGCHNAAQLYREIQVQGFSGKITVVRDFASQLRNASGMPPRIRNTPGTMVKQDPSSRRPTLRGLAHMIGQPPEKLEDREEAFINRLANVTAKLEEMITLAREFAAMIRQRDVTPFDDWLARAGDSLLNNFAGWVTPRQRRSSGCTYASLVKWSYRGARQSSQMSEKADVWSGQARFAAGEIAGGLTCRWR